MSATSNKAFERMRPFSGGGRTLWLILGLGVFGIVIAVVLMWLLVLRPPLDVTVLQPGQVVTLRSGLTMTLPPESSGTLAMWHAHHVGRDASLGLADDVVLRLSGRGNRDAAAAVFWEAQDPGPLVSLTNAAHLLGRTADGTVEVRWFKPASGTYNVFVLTRLPGSLPGMLQLSASEAHDAASAWDSVLSLWRDLDVSGCELPTPSVKVGTMRPGGT